MQNDPSWFFTLSKNSSKRFLKSFETAKEEEAATWKNARSQIESNQQWIPSPVSVLPFRNLQPYRSIAS
jgi:hypothetical protein